MESRFNYNMSYGLRFTYVIASERVSLLRGRQWCQWIKLGDTVALIV